MIGAPGTDKRPLREALLRRRAETSGGDRERWSAAIAGHVTGSAPWHQATAVAAFVGVGSEPDTTQISSAALAAGKRLWLPRVVSKTALDFASVDALEELVAAGFGLREPPRSASGCRLGETGAGLVLVPGLAFGSDGARIGFGRGYYDRALADLGQPRAACVGVCFGAFLDPVEGPIPMGPNDVAVDFVVTEDGLVSTRPRRER